MADGQIERKFATLIEIGGALKCLPDLTSFTDRLVASVTEALGVSACTLSIEETTDLVCLSAIGSGVSEPQFLKLEREMSRRAIEKKSTESQRVSDEKRVRYYSAIPLPTQRTKGSLFVGSLHPLSREDWEFLTAVTHIAALAVDRTRLEEQMDIDLSEFQALLEMGVTVGSVLDIRKLMDVIVHVALRLAGGDSVSLMILDPRTNELTIEAAYGLDRDIIEGTRVKLGEQIAGWVAEKGIPLLLGDVSKDNRFRNLVRKDRGIKSALSVPIGDEQIIGVLNVDVVESDRQFTDHDLDLLNILVKQVSVSLKNARLYAQARDACLEVMQSLVRTVETREEYIKGHSERVTKYALAIARRLNLPDKEVEAIRYAAILHDIGRLGVSRRILSQKGPFTEEERRMVEAHPRLTVKMLKPLTAFGDVLPIIYHHHERYDGHGYVGGLKKTDIPMGSRILAVADAYEAMISERPHRPPMSKEEAINELKKCSGTQFDPEVVEAFLAVLEKKNRSRESSKKSERPRQWRGSKGIEG